MFRKFESFTIIWNQRAWCKGKMLQLPDVITCCVRLQHPGAAATSPCNILQLQHPLLRTSSAPLQAVVQSTEGARITSCKRHCHVFKRASKHRDRGSRWPMNCKTFQTEHYQQLVRKRSAIVNAEYNAVVRDHTPKRIDWSHELVHS